MNLRQLTRNLIQASIEQAQECGALVLEGDSEVCSTCDGPACCHEESVQLVHAFVTDSQKLKAVKP